MIELKDLNGKDFVLNSELIEKIEEIPETKITLITGKYILIKNSSEDVINKVVDFKRRIYGADREIKLKHEPITED